MSLETLSKLIPQIPKKTWIGEKQTKPQNNIANFFILNRIKHIPRVNIISASGGTVEQTPGPTFYPDSGAVTDDIHDDSSDDYC